MRKRASRAMSRSRVPAGWTLVILTAFSAPWVGITIAQHMLQPELAEAQRSPLFRLSALFLVLASAGLAALQRTKLLSPQTLLDLGLVLGNHLKTGQRKPSRTRVVIEGRSLATSLSRRWRRVEANKSYPRRGLRGSVRMWNG